MGILDDRPEIDVKLGGDPENRCPLFMVQAGVAHWVGECLGKNCRWWVDEVQECSIPLLAKQGLAVKKQD